MTVSTVGGNNAVVMEWFAAMGTTVRWLKTMNKEFHYLVENPKWGIVQNIISCVPESETAESPLQQLVHHKKVHSCHNQVRNKFWIKQILISGYM